MLLVAERSPGGWILRFAQNDKSGVFESQEWHVRMTRVEIRCLAVVLITISRPHGKEFLVIERSIGRIAVSFQQKTVQVGNAAVERFYDISFRLKLADGITHSAKETFLLSLS